MYLPQQMVNMASPFNEGLVSWWMNLPGGRWGGGRTLRDLMGRNDGTLTNMDGADWVGAKGRPGGFGALGFVVAETKYVDVGPVVTDYPFTIALWARPIDLSTTGFLYHFANSSESAEDFSALIRDNGNIVIRSRDGQVHDAVAQAFASVNIWYHIVGVYRTSIDRELYIQGISEATSTTLSTPQSIDAGRLGYSGDLSPSNPFSGLLDDIRIYDFGFQAAEASALFRESSAGYPHALNWQRTRGAFVPVVVPTVPVTPQRRTLHIAPRESVFEIPEQSRTLYVPPRNDTVNVN